MQILLKNKYFNSLKNKKELKKTILKINFLRTTKIIFCKILNYKIKLIYLPNSKNIEIAPILKTILKFSDYF
ncbi:hypothetical protein EB354_07910 [Chryseobacterium balustinum]|nr:hypothetical protein EB354_07910 [Chryseobacterium balustinum]